MERWGAIAGTTVCVTGVGLLGATWLQPDVTHLERSIQITAEVQDLLPFLTDYRGFLEWSPWSGLDPKQTVSFSELRSGKGAWYSWSGNADVGRGRMELLAVEPDLVRHHVEFIEPYPAHAETEFLWSESAGTLTVRWTYAGHNDLAAKFLSLFVDMDEVLGPDYERGLLNLKRHVEDAADSRRAGLEVKSG